MQSSLTRRRSSLGLGVASTFEAGPAGGGLRRRPSFSPNHPPNIPLPPVPPPTSDSPTTDSNFSSQQQQQQQQPSRLSRASSPLFPSPTIPLPPLPPTSPTSIRSVSSLQPPRSQSPRPSSSLSNHSTSTSTNPPPHPPPSIPLPTLPKGPSAFRGRGTPSSSNSMDNNNNNGGGGGGGGPTTSSSASSTSSPFGGRRGLDSPLKGVFGDGSPVREFFAASAAAAGSPTGQGTWAGEMKRSLSEEERERERRQINDANAKRNERRFELTVGKMHDARIIGPSLDTNPISPISSGNRSLSPLPPPPSSSLPSIRAPSPLSTSVPKPSPLLPLRTRLSLSPPSHPKPLPPPSADQPRTANTTSPSTSSDYSNRSSTFSTSTVSSSRSSTSSFGHLLLPPLMPTITSTFLHHGVGLPATASKKPDLPSVRANPMKSPEEGQGAFVAETELEGGRTSPDVGEMRRATARSGSSTGSKGAEEGRQEDGWGEESLLVEVREGGGVLKEEKEGESGEESDLDLKSPLATLALQSHFLSPNSRLLPHPSPNTPRRVSGISSSSAPLIGDGWGGSDSEEDDFLSSSSTPGRHLLSGSTYKGRSSLPPSPSIHGGPEVGRLGFGDGDVRRKKMSSQEMVASFPKPPSTPTTSNRASLASVGSWGGGSEDSHATGGGGGGLQIRLSMDPSTNHHRHPSSHHSSTTLTATTTTPTHLSQITTNPSHPSSDSSSTYFPRPLLDRSSSPISSRPASLFSIGTEAGSVYSLGGKLLPRPRRGGEDDAELGEVWGPVEIAYSSEMMKAEGVAFGGAGAGAGSGAGRGGGEKGGSREEWEKAAEMLRERKTLSVQPVGATRAGGVPLRRVSSLMQPGYGGGRQTQQLGLRRPTLGAGGAMRRVSNGDLTVGTVVASSTPPARSQIPPPPQKRQIATSLTIRKPVPAYTPQTPPRPPPSILPPASIAATPTTARRIASVSHLRPPSHIAFPSSPHNTSKLPTATSASSILPPKSPLRKPSVSISRRTSSSSNSLVPPIASLLPLSKGTAVSTSSSSLPLPTLTNSSAPSPSSPSKQTLLFFPPTEPLKIIKKNASQLTLRPPPSPTASSGSGSASTISVALPSPTSPTMMGGSGPKRRMSKVPLPPSAFRLPSQPLVRSP